MLKLFVFIPLIISVFSADIHVENPGKCHRTKYGAAIEWTPDYKLEWSDFKASGKVSKGFSVAASTCGFGYDGIVRHHEMIVNVYVRFYCRESWKNPGYDLPEVLRHEQLHFDICELYGRKLYKGILQLRKDNMLNESNLKRLYDYLIEEYDDLQEKYDAETGHSTEAEQQKRWNKMIGSALKKHEDYAGYREY